jgi:aryl-alcohol dehydrogenase-like predicted oxidoreductase
MEGLDRMVKTGKARYIGISNCFAYQLAKAIALAEKEGFQKFVSGATKIQHVWSTGSQKIQGR